MNKIIYVDMDDVIADYYKATKDSSGKVQEERMFDPKFFYNLEPIPGAKSGVFQLGKMGFDIWILSQPFSLLPESYMEKARWIQLHFPQLLNKIVLTQDKGLHVGHYLIDDNRKKWKEKFEKTGGKFVHFQYGGYNVDLYGQTNPEDKWKDVLEFFKKENPYVD